MHKPSRVTVFIFIGSQFTVIHSLCTLENSDVNTSFITGLKKVLSGCSRQVHVNFSTGQVTFHSHLPNGLKGFHTHMQASRPPPKYKKKYTKNAQGEQTLRAACPKGKLEYKFFFSTALATCCLHSTIQCHSTGFLFFQDFLFTVEPCFPKDTDGTAVYFYSLQVL